MANLSEELPDDLQPPKATLGFISGFSVRVRYYQDDEENSAGTSDMLWSSSAVASCQLPRSYSDRTAAHRPDSDKHSRRGEGTLERHAGSYKSSN
jgi:hypothetical protein